MNKARKYIIEHLGEKCVICGETDVNVLHIDHKYGQGYLEKEYFESDDDMFKFYVMDWIIECEYLQILCMNCNMKKRRENNENSGRPKLEELEQFLLKKPNTDLFIKKYEKKKSLDDFLKENPQFIPIQKRLLSLWNPILDFIREYKIETNDIMRNLNWIPKIYKNAIQFDIEKFPGLYDDIHDYKSKKFPRYTDQDIKKPIFE